METTGAISWFNSAYRMLKGATKPDREEYWLLSRVSLLGLAILGVLGFLVKLITAFFGI